MRRKDREVHELEAMLEILEQCEVVRLGMYDGREPYIVPLNFGYRLEGEELHLYFHSAKEGRKIDIINRNPSVCFEADCSFRLIKGDEACEWSAYHRCVMGTGEVRVLQDVQEKKLGMDCIMKHYGHEGVPRYNEAVFERTLLLELKVEGITGKQNIPNEN